MSAAAQAAFLARRCINRCAFGQAAGCQWIVLDGPCAAGAHEPAEPTSHAAATATASACRAQPIVGQARVKECLRRHIVAA
jgi:hypothetical protein